MYEQFTYFRFQILTALVRPYLSPGFQWCDFIESGRYYGWQYIHAAIIQALFTLKTQTVGSCHSTRLGEFITQKTVRMYFSYPYIFTSYLDFC